MRVLEFPPSESCNNRVRLLLRYGINVHLGSTNADITLPSVDRDRLIFPASFSLCPEDWNIYGLGMYFLSCEIFK